MKRVCWDNSNVKRLSLFAAWLGVLVLATTLTWQIVSAADDRVSDRPLAPLNVAAPVITGADTTNFTAPSSTTAVTVAADPEPSSSTTGTSSTTITTAPSTTSTTPAPATTTTTVGWQTRSVETRGGTVVFRYRPNEVIYQTATPSPGFQVEVDKQGPPEAQVEFESEEDKVEIHASWESGDINIEVSGSSEEDDD